jgi:WD40 repeat protein/DNA-binding XRE family transcriptional regulator
MWRAQRVKWYGLSYSFNDRLFIRSDHSCVKQPLSREKKERLMDQLPIWARQIKQARLERLWTQGEVARRIHASPKAVGRWERGEVHPSVYSAGKLCRLFQKSPQALGLVGETGAGGPAGHARDESRPATLRPSHIDWREAEEVEDLYGRDKICKDLTQWIVEERCRLVAILGAGGIGKTAVAVTVGQHIQSEFEYVIWLSLKNPSPLSESVRRCLTLFSTTQVVDLPKDTESQITLLIEGLQQFRCLLILDNMETLLQANDPDGQWIEGREGYGRLIKRVGETIHQSCLMLTSRERPREISHKSGKAVRVLPLKGLPVADSMEILRKAEAFGTEEAKKALIALYSGNPLALRIVSATIKELFEGDVEYFLKEGTAVYGDVYDLLKQQFRRLAPAEKELLYWLALEREPVSVERLRSDILHTPSRGELLTTLHALSRRSLIESSSGGGFLLQPVIMEYILHELIQDLCREIEDEQPALLLQYALIKAQTKDFLRESQIQLLLKPLVQKLASDGDQQEIEKKLQRLLAAVREKKPTKRNYLAGNILNLLLHLGYDVRGYDFSHLYIRQAYLVGKSLPDVDFSFAHFEESVFTDTFGSILSITFSPDGNCIATGATSCEARIRRIAENTTFLTCQGHAHWIWAVAYHPRGHFLASGSEDQTIRFWDIETGRCTGILSMPGWVFSLAFSPDGQTIVEGGEDQIVRLWNVETKECIARLAGHTDWVRSVAFRSDGSTFASAGHDQTIRLWDVQSQTCLKILKEHTARVRSIAFNTAGTLLASGSEDHTVRLWDATSGQYLRPLYGHTESVIAVAFSPQGELLASGSKDQLIRLWDTRTGQCLHVLQGHINSVISISFDPTGNLLASGGEDQTIRLWDVRTGRCLNIFQGHTNGVVAVDVCADGTLLVSGNEDNVLRLWDMRTKRCLTTLRGHTNWVWAVAFSPTDDLLASGSEDRTIRLWDLPTGTCRAVLEEHTNRVGSVAFSPDGHLLVSGSNDQTLKIWDTASGQCLRTFEGHTSRIETVAFGRAGNLVASGSEDLTIRLWDVQTGNCLSVLPGHTERVRSVAFSPDGNLLASGSYDRSIRLWNVQTGACVKTLQGHTDHIRSVAFSPDGSVMASGSYDRSIRLWNVQTGACVKTLRGHTDWVRSVVFHRDGYLLVSGSRDGTVQIWDREQGTCLASLRNERPYEGMTITGVVGLTEAQKKTLAVLGAYTEDNSEPGYREKDECTTIPCDEL